MIVREINQPESSMAGCITRGGRFQYTFKALDSLAIIFVEVKLKIESDAARKRLLHKI
jgi:hypothetical protein